MVFIFELSKLTTHADPLYSTMSYLFACKFVHAGLTGMSFKIIYLCPVTATGTVPSPGAFFVGSTIALTATSVFAGNVVSSMSTYKEFTLLLFKFSHQ